MNFVAVYLLLIAGGIALWAAVPGADRIDEEFYLHAHVQGTHRLIAARFATTASADWPDLREHLQRDFAYPVRLLGLDAASAALTATQQVALHDGAVVIDSNHNRSYQRLAGSDQVIALGDFYTYAPPAVPWYDSDAMHYAVMLLNVVMAVAVPLYFLVYRVWRDVYALGRVTLAIQDGRLDVAIPAVRTRLVQPLQEALQGMASRLRTLMDAQRILADAVAHEIRTPLARMRFGVEMLREADDQPERDRQQEGLLLDISQLERLTEAGVGYSRIGRLPRVQRAPLQVGELFAQVMDAQPPPQRGVQLRSEIDPGISLRANREALQLALRNLLGNALRFAHHHVRLSATREGDWVVLAVDDDGRGVGVLQRDQIFVPYVQLHPHADGFGLGLAIVRVVAEKHGGRADVVQSPLGGARFRLLLPT